MAIFVTKANGTREPFDNAKLVRTCRRMGATEETAHHIAKSIEARLFDGIETKNILRMIFVSMRKHKPILKHMIDLRKSLSLLRSKPDFELFIQLLLKEYGYDVVPNLIIRGKCVEHEVDALASKEGKTMIVEVKHHFDYHTPTGLDEARIARAVFEDATEGHEIGSNDLGIDEVMIVSNTKLSGHAERYVNCRNIKHVGWSHPPKSDLQNLIEDKKLYPITILRGLRSPV
ncbi:restriction endonuclease, partial [Candidatus Bathyarchaeota archaeon]|nr:restriction endonuclease [Candidatus Bathyarchaeota archaeon]